MRTFTCFRCRVTFKASNSEEETLKEYEANFTTEATEGKDSLCDDCYEVFWKWAAIHAPHLKRVM